MGFFKDKLPPCLLLRVSRVLALLVVPEILAKRESLLAGEFGQILLDLVHRKRAKVDFVLDQVLFVALLSFVQLGVLHTEVHINGLLNLIERAEIFPMIKLTGLTGFLRGLFQESEIGAFIFEGIVGHILLFPVVHNSLVPDVDQITFYFVDFMTVLHVVHYLIYVGLETFFSLLQLTVLKVRLQKV